MADQDAQDRTLPASARKLKKAREQGQVPRSRDLGHFASVSIGGAVLVAALPWASRWLTAQLAQALSFDAGSVADPRAMTERLAELTSAMMWMVLPLGVLMALVAVGVSMASGGWNFTLKPLQPKFAFLNPLAGIGRLFSKQQLVTTLKACLLALVLGTIGALYLRAHVGDFVAMLAMDLPEAVGHGAGTLLGGLALLVLALALFAVIDVPLQRKLHADRLKMSHAEAKQEHKESEGNQEVKGKQKAKMREVSRRRMLAAIPKADLVVMNPTHYAVALKYDDGRMGAPRVVAKGVDLLAMKIRDIAKESKVPVLQAPVLARALYAHTKLDQEIPQALFAAVAQVLAYVYQLRAALAGRGKAPGELPELNVPPELDPQNKPVPDMELYE